MKIDKRKAAAWSAIALNAFFSCFWAFWGIIENFHEGWYYDSVWMNMGLMLYQYLLFSIVFTWLGLLSLRFPRTGSSLFVLIGIAVPVFRIQSFSAVVAFSIPMVLIGLLYWFGRLEKRKWGYMVTLLLPAAVIIGCGIEPAVRISQRIDDGFTGERLVEGNGVKLIWAPEGPGWITKTEQMTGVAWDSAVKICSYLSEDGKSFSDTALNIWRLPTIEEAAGSLTRNGKNAGGIWNSQNETANYQILPDKESPLWKVNSPIIYWWTSSQPDSTTAWRIVYNGSTQKLRKKTIMGSLGFRAVKNVPETK